jgi:non-specific serine/threonine protein kinase
MLATIREYAAERFDATAETAAVRLRHAEWYVGIAERGRAALTGGMKGAEGARWAARLEREHANLRVALGWSIRERTDLFLRACSALRNFWWYHGHVREGTQWLELALAASAEQPAALRAPILHGVSMFSGLKGDRERERNLAAEALELYREIGDQRGTAVLLRTSGVAAARSGDLSAAEAFYEESATLFRQLDDVESLAMTISNLGDLALKRSDFARARDLCSESLALQRELGATFGMILSLNNLGVAALHQERIDDARTAFEEAVRLSHDLGASDMVGVALEGLGAVAVADGDCERGARLLGSAESIRAATGIELETAERALHERTLSSLRAARSGDDIQAAIAEGAAMPEEAAVGLALSAAAQRVRAG